MSEWLVAVDFGTTATAAAVRSGDGPARALVFGDGGSTVPSSVYAEGPGQLLVGTEADNEAEFRLDAYEPTPKRRVGEQTVRLGNWDFRPAELIGAVIASVLAEAMRQHQNTVPSQVVLTHPAAWRASRRAVLTDALTVAASRLAVALPAPKFIAEPVAAAQWYAHSRGHTDGAVFAVYDLGGGTFDTTILRAGRDGFDVMASGGIDPLGGFDFDTALFSHLGQTYIAAADPTLWTAMSSTERADPDIARQRRRLQQRVTLLKIGLSTSTDKRIQLPGLEGPAVVTRGEYEALIAGHLEATITELQDTIADAGITSEQLAAIYRIGGASRTPLVGAELERLRVPVEVLDQPKLVVAQGAAMNSRPTAAASTATEKGAVPASETTGGEPDEPSTAHEGTVDPTAESQPQLVDEDLDSAPGNDVLESGPVPPLISLWKLALRAFALGPLSIVLVYATGFSWPLTMLFGHAFRFLSLFAMVAGVAAAGVHVGRRYGRNAALVVIASAIVGITPVFFASRAIYDVLGYVSLIILVLTRPRTPTKGDAARHLGAGVGVLAATFAMTAAEANWSDVSFASEFLDFENGDWWIPLIAGLMLILVGAYYYKALAAQQSIGAQRLTQKEAFVVVVACILTTVLFIVVVVATHPGLKVTQSGSGRGAGRPATSQAMFDGTYVRSYDGSALRADGSLFSADPGPTTMVTSKAACRDDGCVAVSITHRTDSRNVVREWDYLDGQWVSVTAIEGTTDCANTTSTDWRTSTLTPQPDGSLTGQDVDVWTAGCYATQKVTYRRTDNAGRDPQLPAPASLPARVDAPPASGFHGAYMVSSTMGTSSPTYQSMRVQTSCLRTGERCGTSVMDAEKRPGMVTVGLEFANGSWTGTASGPSCAGGGARRAWTYNLPLPINPKNPIATLEGAADITGASSCEQTGPNRLVFERTGD